METGRRVKRNFPISSPKSFNVGHRLLRNRSGVSAFTLSKVLTSADGGYVTRSLFAGFYNSKPSIYAPACAFARSFSLILRKTDETINIPKAIRLAFATTETPKVAAAE